MEALSGIAWISNSIPSPRWTEPLELVYRCLWWGNAGGADKTRPYLDAKRCRPQRTPYFSPLAALL